MALGILGVVTLVDLAVKVLDTIVGGADAEGAAPTVSQIVRLIDIVVKNRFFSELDFKNHPDEAADKVLTAIKELKKSLGLDDNRSLNRTTAQGLIEAVEQGRGCPGAERDDITQDDTPPDSDVPDWFYRVEGNLPIVPGSDATSLVERAILAWQLVAHITFRRATDSSQSANLIIGEAAIDGSGGTIGLGDVGTGRGDNRGLKLVFDIGENEWTAEKFFLTACHELGHCLGLGHEDGSSPDDLMHPILMKELPADLMSALAANNADSDMALVKLVKSERLFSKRDMARMGALWEGDVPPVDNIEPDFDFTNPSGIVFE